MTLNTSLNGLWRSTPQGGASGRDRAGDHSEGGRQRHDEQIATVLTQADAFGRLGSESLQFPAKRKHSRWYIWKSTCIKFISSEMNKQTLLPKQFGRSYYRYYVIAEMLNHMECTKPGCIHGIVSYLSTKERNTAMNRSKNPLIS